MTTSQSQTAMAILRTGGSYEHAAESSGLSIGEVMGLWLVESEAGWKSYWERTKREADKKEIEQ